MLSKSALPAGEKLRLLHPVELFQLCAADRENSDAWSEFLIRYTVRLKYFIRGTLHQVLGHSADLNSSATLGGIQESDLFQNAIVRLVVNDCAAMKRFSGTTEEELVAYLAVISRSAVMDALRRHKAIKRRPIPENDGAVAFSSTPQKVMNNPELEREILTRELLAMAQRSIKSHSGEVSTRDQLVFELHFFEGLSLNQIAQCGGINLSKAGVEKLLKRLIGRVQTLASAGKSEVTLS